MRARVLTLGSVLFVSPAAHAAPKEQLTGNVLVWQDAVLVVDAAAPQKTIQLAKLDGDRASSLGMVVPMHVVGTTGDLIEVEPIDGTECVDATLRTRDLKSVRLFVDPKDLAPVVTKAFSAKYPDGTRVDIAAGTPVQPQGTGFVVAFSSEQVPVAIPAASVGTSYTPHKVTAPKSVANAKLLYRMMPKTTAKLGDQPFAISESASPPLSTKVEAKDKVTLFPLQATCASAKVAVPSDSIRSFSPEKKDVVTARTSSAQSGGGDMLPKGTPLFVGTRKIAVTTTERSVIKGTPYCFAIVPYVDEATDEPHVKLLSPQLEACAKDDVKLVHRKVPPTVLAPGIRRD